MAAKKTVKKTKAIDGSSARAAEKVKSQAEPETKKLSALDGAVRVLGETSQAMTCKEMVEAMAVKGYWKSPGGRTPQATLYSAILREINLKVADARFAKAERGKFTLAKASL